MTIDSSNLQSEREQEIFEAGRQAGFDAALRALQDCIGILRHPDDVDITSDDVLEVFGLVPIEQLGLSTRVINALKLASIGTAGQLTNVTEQQLHALERVGDSAVQEIKDRLAVNGLALKQSE